MIIYAVIFTHLLAFCGILATANYKELYEIFIVCLVIYLITLFGSAILTFLYPIIF